MTRGEEVAANVGRTFTLASRWQPASRLSGVASVTQIERRRKKSSIQL
jgi:hypothetical protein